MRKVLLLFVGGCLVFLLAFIIVRRVEPLPVKVVPIPFRPPAAIVDQAPSPVVTPTLPPKSSGDLLAKVLMFHYIRAGVDAKKDPIGYGLSIPPDQFAHQLSVIKQQGYTPEHMSDLLAGRGGAHSVVLTFDDGYEDFYTTAYPILKQYGWTATLYIVTGKIGGDYMTWDQIRELQKAGFEIGAHTVNHLDLSKLSEAAQHKELEESKATLERQLDVPITALCYPSGKYNDTTLSLAKQLGYTNATTTQPGVVYANERDMFTLKRLRMHPDMSDKALLDVFN